MNDGLFENEQNVYDIASSHLEEIRKGVAAYDIKSYETLLHEYGMLLKQSRVATNLADMTKGSLNTISLEMLDKANYDELTGIYNRIFVDESLSRTIKTLSRSENVLSVLMVDIDFFKIFNDTYGIDSGDECLKSIAAAIKGCLKRADDVVARYGGDEFVVVLPYSDNNGACTVAAKIIESISQLGIQHSKSEAADVITVSVGGATGKVSFTQSGSEYIERAVEALNTSVQNGRNMSTCLEL